MGIGRDRNAVEMRGLATGEGERPDTLDPRLGIAGAQEERDEAGVLRRVRRRRAHVEVAVDEDDARAPVDDDLSGLDAFLALGFRVRLGNLEPPAALISSILICAARVAGAV